MTNFDPFVDGQHMCTLLVSSYTFSRTPGDLGLENWCTPPCTQSHKKATTYSKTLNTGWSTSKLILKNNANRQHKNICQKEL